MASPAITGHAPRLAALSRDIETNNVSHAYLFAGRPHLGKSLVARWFAAQLLTRGMDADAKKEVQHRIDRLIHPDFLSLDQLWIEEVCDDWDEIALTSNIPQQHRAKAPVMKTDVIGIDDVRVIQDRLYETGEGTTRVCFIRGIERMRDEAANAFLKILEEPPPGRVFVLTTESSAQLLPTIRSRARILRFSPVVQADMHPLVEGMSDDDAKFILHVSQGAPGTAISLRDDPDTLRERQTVHTQARNVWSGSSVRERLHALAPLHERGTEAETFLFHMALTLREAGSDPAAERRFRELVAALKTNAHRQLLVQRFAMGLDSRA